MKGGLAAMIDAAERWIAADGLARAACIVAAVADEEYASLGAEALVREWRADGAVITEPTDLASRSPTRASRAWNMRRARPCRARQPAAGRHATRSCDGPRARAARGARPGTPCAAAASACSAPARCTPRPIAGGTELSVYPAHCRCSRTAHAAGRRRGRALHEVRADPRPCCAPRRPQTSAPMCAAAGAACVLRSRGSSAADHAAARLAACVRTRRADHRDELLDRRRDVRGRPAFRR